MPPNDTTIPSHDNRKDNQMSDDNYSVLVSNSPEAGDAFGDKYTVSLLFNGHTIRSETHPLFAAAYITARNVADEHGVKDVIVRTDNPKVFSSVDELFAHLAKRAGKLQ